MTTNEPGFPRARQDPVNSTPTSSFDGYPYLVTLIGRTPLRHVAILPREWPRERLVELARRQAAANRFNTYLCLGPREADYVTPDGVVTAAGAPPPGILLKDRLVLAEHVPVTRELRSRRASLTAWCASHRPRGYLVGDGLEGGRAATQEEAQRLGVRRANGMPAGLRRCRRCHEFKGDYLALKGEGNRDWTPRVIQVHCQCANHNRCARCGSPLAERRLSAYEYDRISDKVLYRPAYMGLRHRCEAGDPKAVM